MQICFYVIWMQISRICEQKNLSCRVIRLLNLDFVTKVVVTAASLQVLKGGNEIASYHSGTAACYYLSHLGLIFSTPLRYSQQTLHFMQQPTCTNVRIRSTADAHKIFGSIQQGLLHMVTRRLDAEERLALRSGCVYAWEERGPHSEITGLGIERFTEGRRWSPSRVRDVCIIQPSASDS